MNLYGILQSDTSDLSISLYVTKNNDIHYWVRAGIALIGLESMEDVGELIHLLIEAKHEVLNIDLNGEEDVN